MSIKQHMLAAVLREHPDAKPCGGETLADSFRYSRVTEEWQLWYNFDIPGAKGTTGVLTERHLMAETNKLIMDKAYVKY